MNKPNKCDEVIFEKAFSADNLSFSGKLDKVSTTWILPTSIFEDKLLLIPFESEWLSKREGAREKESENVIEKVNSDESWKLILWRERLDGKRAIEAAVADNNVSCSLKTGFE